MPSMTQALGFPDKRSIHRFVLEKWMAAVAAGDFESAICYDQLHYNELVKKTEDASYWDLWQKDTLPTRRKLTNRFDAAKPLSLPTADGHRRFLIVHHNYSGLAHETQMARNMAYLRQHGVEFEVEIAYLFGSEEQRDIAAQLYGVNASAVHYLQAQSYTQAGEKLAQLTLERQIQGVIYPSIFFMAFWMSLFVPHANQKFVQMKYYPLHAGRIRCWSGGYRVAREHYRINGCDFKQLPILDLQLSKGLRQNAQPDSLERISLGSISRPEKICDKIYNQFIADALKRYPELDYLYTGRESALEVIPLEIRQHPRCKALGWVDPTAAIAKFSIYLEPFPWGGGEMTLLAMQAGLPYLTLVTEESKRFGIYGFIQQLAAGRDPLLQYSFCRSRAELQQRLGELIADRDLRLRLGAAWHEAVLNFQAPSLDSWRSLFTD
jgi:hypothetical protein